VTIYDEIVESVIKEDVERYYSGHLYIMEATGLIARGKEYPWIIDPLISLYSTSY